MPVFDNPRRYVLEAFIQADDALARYGQPSEDRQKYLHAAAEVLCKAFNQLLDDKDFWAQLESFSKVADSDGFYERDMEPLLRDFKSFIDMEHKVLQEAGVPAHKIEKMLSFSYVPENSKKLSPEMVQRLRELLRSSGKVVCKVVPRFPNIGKYLRWVVAVSNGMVAAGGVALIVVNGVATGITLGAAGASILSGATAAISRLEAIEKSFKGED